jgi:hypothetical protein
MAEKRSAGVESWSSMVRSANTGSKLGKRNEKARSYPAEGNKIRQFGSGLSKKTFFRGG